MLHNIIREIGTGKQPAVWEWFIDSDLVLSAVFSICQSWRTEDCPIHAAGFDDNLHVKHICISVFEDPPQQWFCDQLLDQRARVKSTGRYADQSPYVEVAHCQ